MTAVYEAEASHILERCNTLRKAAAKHIGGPTTLHRITQQVHLLRAMQNPDGTPKYPRLTDYVWYHGLIGSSPMPGVVHRTDDLPGDDSIERFLESLAEAPEEE